MNNPMMKIFAGVSKIFQNTHNVIKEQHSDYVEQNILQNNYVTREEFEQLKNLVLKLQKSLKK